MKLIQRRAYGFRNFKNYPCVCVFCTAEMAGKLFRNLSEKLPAEGACPAFGVEPTLVAQDQANKKALAAINCKGFICKLLWSGKRDLNPQPSAWEADTLPLSYSRKSGAGDGI